ncbi:MAG: hypothetical protein CME63_04675 [Halobacteriovoraceae bacterium]|nr:hypothetical protein [Halobacteriovoraceae bacterium]|tara:strand:+ start:30253 stop:31092 length:840 start_codon:yes stop_codon:yes gene_type:complete
MDPKSYFIFSPFQLLLKKIDKVLVIFMMSFVFMSPSLIASVDEQRAPKYSYEINDPTTSTVTEESFHKIFYGVFSLYQDDMRSFRVPVVPVPEWSNPYLTAYTANVDGIMKLGFWGGMARIPGMNDDAVALITCHEVGHILGGSPYIRIAHPMYDGVSSEGQADYFATQVCLKKYFSRQVETLDYLNKAIDYPGSQLCHHSHISSWEEAICLRTISAIRGFSSVMKLLKPDEGEFSLNWAEIKPATETLHNSYPKNQCRINTFLAGLFDQERPRCWFKK